MPNLVISVNCLCLFVPNPGKGTVHVLMPPTEGHHEHVVHVLYRGSPPEGTSIKGWALKLGGASGSADASLQPEETPTKGETIVDLTEIAGPVNPELIEDDAFPRIAARVDLRAGRMTRLHSEARWALKKKKVAMAHKVVWTIRDVSDDQLEWTPMGEVDGGPPFGTLSELADGNGNVSLEIYHVTRDALPPASVGTLDPEAVREHFQAFYDMYNHEPDEDHLPSDPERIGGANAFIQQLVKAAREDRDPKAIDRLAEFAEQLVAPGSEKDKDGAPDLQALSFKIDKYNCPTGKGSLV